MLLVQLLIKYVIGTIDKYVIGTIVKYVIGTIDKICYWYNW